MHRLPNGQWLISGRTVGDGLALRETLERSLLIALARRRSARPRLRGHPRPLCRAARSATSPRSPTGSARRDLSQRVPAVGRRRRVRPARPADQRDARPDQRADGGAADADRLARARPALAGQPAAIGGACRGRDQRSRRSRKSCSASVIRQADSLMRILTAVLEISRSEALTGRNQFAWFDARRARRRARRNVRAAGRGSRRRCCDIDRPARPCRCSAIASCSPRRSATSSRMRSATARTAARSGSRVAAQRQADPDRGRRPRARHSDRALAAKPAALRPARFEPLGGRRRARPRAGRGDRPSPRRQADARGQSAGVADRARAARCTRPRSRRATTTRPSLRASPR